VVFAIPVTFIAYINESGDTGLETVKKPEDPQDLENTNSVSQP
jgi:hypothetical protein